MVNEEYIDELSYWKLVEKHLDSSNTENEDTIKEIDEYLENAKQTKNEKTEPIRLLILKTKIDDNPLKIEKYASDVITKEEEIYNNMEQRRDLLIERGNVYYNLKKEISRKTTILKSKSTNVEDGEYD